LKDHFARYEDTFANREKERFINGKLSVRLFEQVHRCKPAFINLREDECMTQSMGYYQND